MAAFDEMTATSSWGSASDLTSTLISQHGSWHLEDSQSPCSSFQQQIYCGLKILMIIIEQQQLIPLALYNNLGVALQAPLESQLLQGIACTTSLNSMRAAASRLCLYHPIFSPAYILLLPLTTVIFSLCLLWLTHP